MKTKHRQKHFSSNVVEAIETLSTIANFDIENHKDQHDAINSEQIKRSQFFDSSKGNGHIKELFSVILSYLKNFYKNEYSYLTDSQTLEGIKAIMALVGDAAKKIDRYTLSPKNKISITQLKEYKQLNDFYNTRIAHQMDEGVIGKWILALSQQRINRQRELLEEREFKSRTLEDAPRHLFVNLDSVKKDSEYELFFIRKEDGSLYFSPRLLRNIKLICDFSGTEVSKDPIVDMPYWIDFQMHSAAKLILHSIHDLAEQFFHEAMKFKHRELVSVLNKGLIALFLSANPRNLSQELQASGENRKNCRDYFVDFLSYLHEALNTNEYHKIIAYQGDKTKGLNHLLCDILHGICRVLYLSLHRFHDFDSVIHKLITSVDEGNSVEKSAPASTKHSLYKRIENEYAALSKLFKHHSRGPLTKTLAAVQDGFCHTFDPFTHLNLPSQLYALAIRGHKIVNLHLPSPTSQEYIHRVSVVNEFKGFLRSCMTEYPHHKHLIINLQDRTSWREHFRSIALEELRMHDFDKSIVVVTFAKDTDFYHQLPPYQQQNHTKIFLEHFKEHLGDENSGYYFPSTIKSNILANFADGVMHAIHRLFFNGKNTLTRDQRLEFIEIFDVFLTLKMIDIVNPNSFSLTCKDGVDVSSSCNALLYIFLKLIGKEPFNEDAWTQFNRVLYAPAIILRERPILKERLERILGALKTIEYVYRDLGHEVFQKTIQEAFGHFYKNPILKGSLVKVLHE